MELSDIQKGVLLRLEEEVVNRLGLVNPLHFSKKQLQVITDFHKEGFIQWGEVIDEDVLNGRTNWVQLSDDAWTIAQGLRRHRALHGWNHKHYKIKKNE